VGAETLDVLRVARERFLANLDPGPRQLLIVDDTGGSLSLTALAFAAVIGEDACSTNLVVPALDPSLFKELSSYLDLKQVETEPGETEEYDSLANQSITVSVPAGDLQQSDVFAALQKDRGVPGRSRDEQAERQILLLPSSSAESAITWALRRADALVLVHQRGTSRTQDLRGIIRDAEAFRTPLAGSLLLGHKHRS